MNKNGTYFVDPTLGKLLDKFLAERRESTDGDGWAQITDEDLGALHDVLECLVEMKCEGDADGDRPIEWDLTNRRTHHRMHYRPVPYSHRLNDLEGEEEVDGKLKLLSAISMNHRLASEDMNRLLSGLDYTLLEEKRAMQEENDE